MRPLRTGVGSPTLRRGWGAPGFRGAGALRLAGRLLFVAWAAFTLTFFLMRLLPGDAATARLTASNLLTDEQVAELRHQYGLDEPLVVQYLTQLLRLITLQWGRSWSTGADVAETVFAALGSTATLAAAALLLISAACLLLGYYVTTTRHRFGRRLASAISILGVSMPTFWVGIILIQIFSFQLGWFPALGDDGAHSLVLPAIAIAMFGTGAMSRVLIRSLSAEWQRDYASGARLRGLSNRQVFFGFVLRGAAAPFVTQLGIAAATLISGAIETEVVFSRPGIGRLLQTSIMTNDLPYIQVITVLVAVAFVLVISATDLVVARLQPRGERTGAAR
ncbi:ABC transporter permease [Leucobacter weissii]|uniref:ABC transporter permease n=1 Tax=Leucobacter weissii TaxID=1983706 RepID=A0A939MI98_9MICO|nr:ABC transporter permease [Leucobacter weissii]MBO1900525.1 ABC transporter permease [Leucobacter weissii]